jgi:uncharacterized protein (TIGR01244 family)
MRISLLFSAAASLLLATSSARAQQFTGEHKLGTLSTPVPFDKPALFQDKIARVGEDVFIGGQPSEEGLREMKARGVTVVVNLRTPEEMQKQVHFDEPALAAQLGMKYVYLPVRGNGDFPYSPETVAKFTDALRGANGKVLLHCTIGWRASHLWAAYLIKTRGVAVDDALANARAINLMDEHHPANGGREPVEDFLGRDLAQLRK